VIKAYFNLLQPITGKNAWARGRSKPIQPNQTLRRPAAFRATIEPFAELVTGPVTVCDAKCDGFFARKPFSFNQCDGVTAFYPPWKGRRPFSLTGRRLPW
jgi:hypothetical protein